MADNSNYIGVAMGLDVTDLKAGISEANKQIQLANSQFKAATSGMDDWTKSTEGLNAKIKQLDSVFDMQSRKLAGLKAEYEKVANEQGENSEAARKLQIQINNQQSVVNKTERELKNYRQTLKDAEAGNINLEEVTLRAGKAVEKSGKQAEAAGDGFTVAKGAVAGFIANGLTALVGAAKDAITSLFSLAEETREYREDIGKLKTAFEDAGHTTEEATATYKELFSVFGEEDRAVEAAQQIAALADSEEEMARMTTIATGAWAKWGDSLATESLMEGINHTAKLGEVQGTLADALEWCGITVDDFNEQLADKNTEEERSALILDTLEELYSETAKTYRENNKAVIESRKATSDYTDTMAELGEAMEPVSADINGLKATFAKELTPLIKNNVIPAFRGFFDELQQEGTVKKFTSAISNVAKTVLPALAKALKFAAENFDTLAVAGFSIITVFKSVKAAMAISTAITAAKTALAGLTAGVGAATKAQTVWNAAMSANPIGAVITAVGLLASGIAFLVSSQDDATESTDLLTESQRETVTAAEEAAEAYRETKKAAEEMAAAELAQLDHTANLWKELQKLVDENGKVKEGYEGRANFILNELNEALGMEYTLNGNIIDQYGEMVKSIEGVINAKRAEILLEAYEKSYIEALQKRGELETSMAIKAQELFMQEQVIADKKAEIARQQAQLDGEADARTRTMHQQHLNSLQSELLAEQNKLGTLKEKYAESNETLEGYYADISRYEQAHGLIMSGEVDKALGYLNNLESGFMSAEGVRKSAAYQAKKTEQEKSQYLKDTLQQQVIDTEINARLMKEAYTQGVEGVSKEMVDTAEEQARLAKKEFEAVGGDITKGIADGAEGETYTLNSAMENVVTKALNAAKSALGIQSPSRVMADEVGEPITQGIAVGIEKAIPEVERSLDYLNDSIRTHAPSLADTIGGYSTSGSTLLAQYQSGLQNYKVYNSVSLREEMKYWDEVRKQIEVGTQERIDADSKYFAAKVAYEAEIQKKSQERAAAAEKAAREEAEAEKKRVKTLEDMAEDMTSVAKKRENIESKYAKASSKVWTDTANKIATEQKKYADAVDSRTNQIVSSMNLFSEMEIERGQSGDGMIDALQSQVDSLEQWATALSSLTERGVDAGLIDELQAMGVEATGYLEAMVSMSDEKLSEYVALWQEKNNLAREQATKELEPLNAETAETIKQLQETAQIELEELRASYKEEMLELSADYAEIVQQATENGISIGQNQIDEYFNLGEELMHGIALGFGSADGSLLDAVKKVINDSVKAAQETAEIHSPSKLFRRKVGVFLGQGIGVGILDSIKNIKGDIKTFNDYVAQNLGNVKGNMQAFNSATAAARTPATATGTGNAGNRQTVINAGLNVHYNGTLSRKELKRMENDHYLAVKTKLKKEGAI